MNKNDFLGCLRTRNFTRLFIESGWNRPTSTVQFSMAVGETLYVIREVAQRGLKVFVCDCEQIPASSTRRVLDSKLRKFSQHYMIAYVSKSEQMHHLWSVPVRVVDKRDLVTVEYANEEQSLFLLEKINAITFGFDEDPPITDVVCRVANAFLVNAEKITKKFYKGFRLQRTALVKAIKGVDSDADKDWYASVMLNRLMFCYFIQKKGFLDQNECYLQDKLNMCRRKGDDLFYGKFYRRFLRVLFHDGLNSRQRTLSFRKTYGRVPYLNGGMFEEHLIEKRYKDLDIPDSFFIGLFEFFDQWHWHLDARITASGSDINPDVLGFIFEQYINDRAKMGAYYTKEDITGYICRNSIVGYLLNKLRRLRPEIFEKGGIAYQLLVGSKDRYIHAELLKGVDDALKTDGNGLNDYVESDKVLPTELWREYLCRCERVAYLRKALVSGKISTTSDLIRDNLDLRQYLEDIIRETEDLSLVSLIYEMLRDVKVLDPACGSGAFLFAALNVLEGLYETCLDRIEEKSADGFFVNEKAELTGQYRANRQFFVYKNIILRNLYGVDIMREATEIARLRLFLKLVSVVDVNPYDENLGLDPLPDIEFNVRSGNSLIGYLAGSSATEDIRKNDLFADAEVMPRLEGELSRIAELQREFKILQLAPGDHYNELWDAKVVLRERLDRVSETLNEGLFRAHAMEKYSVWLERTKPFHWYASFYAIMHNNGGFDVVVGNPPYVKNSEVEKLYSLDGYETRSSRNVYTAFIERATKLCNEKGLVSFIVQLPLVCTDGMAVAQRYMQSNFGELYYATFDDRPGKLFDQLEHIRATIFFGIKQGDGSVSATVFNRWPTELRDALFSLIAYRRLPELHYPGAVAKIGTAIEASILTKLLSYPERFADREDDSGYEAYYHNAPLYWVRGTKEVPFFRNDRGDERSSQIKPYGVKTLTDLDLLLGVLNSSLFYLWYIAFSDTRHLNVREIERFPVAQMTSEQQTRLSAATSQLMADYERHKERKSTFYEATGNVEYDEYHPGASKLFIDKVDGVLAEIYGLTEGELDYVRNFNYKFRMGQYLRRGNA